MSERPIGIVAGLETDRPDWLLDIFVKLATRDIHIPITLFINGMLVSGEIVTVVQYLEGIGGSLSNATFSTGTLVVDDNSLSMVQAAFQTTANALADDYKREIEKQDRITTSGYIHLANAHIFSAAGEALSSGPGVYWRGWLKSVNGFVLGVPK